MKPARAAGGAEDRFPIEITRFYLADGGVAAIGATRRRAHSMAALGKVEPVAHCPPHAVIRNPPNQRSVHAALQNEILSEAAHGIVSQGGGDACVQPEATAQAPRNVVFAAALPHLEMARGVDAALARIEAKHHFTQTQAIPPARVLGHF